MRLKVDHVHKNHKNKHKNLLESLEEMQSNIRLLCQELWYNILDGTGRLDIEVNIAALAKGKTQLSMEIGLK